MIRVVRETYETPADVARELALAGGGNRFGEPNYRAVWGWSRLDWIGGKWEDRDDGGKLLREVMEVRLEPKYAPHNRWHIERWVPAESYGSPEQWRAETMKFKMGETFRSRAISIARRIRALLHARRAARRVLCN